MSTDDKGRNKAKRMLDQWRAKLSDVDFKESAAKKYDAIAGEISVLSFSFTSLPKVLTGVAKSVYEFKDKKGIKITQGLTYEFIRSSKGIIVDAQLVSA
ncbi:hypothetical protein [Selenomonas ruminantium]|uniref:hypothetical protein n=1 Tax=Selenomonas ruminantium TaxID=971 RepID=UPI00047D765A|nr:hypothetical protein [Selenomonas ruminantium]